MTRPPPPGLAARPAHFDGAPNGGATHSNSVDPVDAVAWFAVRCVPLPRASDSSERRDRRSDAMLGAVVSADGGLMRGTVRAETARGAQRRYGAAVEARLGWRPVPGGFTLLAVDISDVTYIGHDEADAQHVARWPDGGEYIRRSLTPASLGSREPVSRLLADGGPT